MVRIKLIAFIHYKNTGLKKKTTPVARLVSKSHLTRKELGQETFKMNLEHLLKQNRRKRRKLRPTKRLKNPLKRYPMAREGTMWASVRLLTTIVSTNILNSWVYNDVKKAGKPNPLFSKLSKEMNQAFVLVFPIRTTALGSWGNVPYRVGSAAN